MLRLLGLIGGALAGILVLWLAASEQETAFEDAGLGYRTTGVYLEHDAGHFHCVQASDAQHCLEDSKVRNPRSRWLWLGASQLYGINDLQPDDKPAPWWVFDALVSQGVDVLTLSQPNGHFEEHAILLDLVRNEAKLDGLILAAVYDDMRERGVREDIATASKLPGPQTPSSEAAIAAAGAAASPSFDDTWQARIEASLTARLESCCHLESVRKQARGHLALGLTEARRFIETLRSRYTRDLSRYRVHIPSDAYAINRAALEHMLSVADQSAMRVLIYIAPRPADFFPYDPADYAAFKKDIETLARQYGADFANWEDIVPDELWGTVDLTFGFPVRDPFHFKGRGHVLLAEHVIGLLGQPGP